MCSCGSIKAERIDVSARVVVVVGAQLHISSRDLSLLVRDTLPDV